MFFTRLLVKSFLLNFSLFFHISRESSLIKSCFDAIPKEARDFVARVIKNNGKLSEEETKNL